jgi:predicted nucleotidyltransferase component of viral defense system
LDTKNNEKGVIMAKVDFYSIPREEKVAIFDQAGNESGIPSYAVEKDWWVVQTLAIVFDTEIAPHLIFKGGTSLSKGWGLIQRFSEDIDIAIDRAFFGFDGPLNRKQIDKLRKNAGGFVDTEFFVDLQTKVLERGFETIKLELEQGERSDRDRSILLHYPYVTKSPGYLKPRVKIEFSCRSLMEPSTKRKFNSLIDEVFPHSDFSEQPITVPTVNPERTFLEKLFLLHEEFQRPAERIRSGERLSRHLYDVVKLSKTEFFQKALADPNLYQTIVAHRQQFNLVPGINYRLHRPDMINPIPADAVWAEWEADYNTMRQEMIYDQESPTFEQLIADLQELKRRVNTLPWSFDDGVLSF